MNLLRLELRKLLPYRAFWTIIGLFTILPPLLFYSGSNLVLNGSQMGSQLYNFPGVWQNAVYLSSFFTLLLSILVIVLVTDEISFRTLRQQVINGLSRADVILAKGSVIVLLAVYGTAVVSLMALFFGYQLSAASKPFSLEGSKYLAGFFVQAAAYMALALFIGLLIKRSGLAIMCFLLYSYVVEPLIRTQLPDQQYKYLPMKAFSALTPMPGREMLEQATGLSNEMLLYPQALVAGALYTLLFLFLAYSVLRLRDL